MGTTYDVIVIGARCAGSPAAMLLARKGYRVLLVDHASFPSDTLSTHVIQAPGVAALRRWGLLDAVRASGAPPVPRYSFDFGQFTLSGTPRPSAGISTAYAPRRTVLDKILVDAAAAAGVEVRERFSVDDIVIDDGVAIGIRGHGEGGAPITERARIIIGADGRNSRVARTVNADSYHNRPVLQWAYYTYWRDLPVTGFEIYIRPQRGFAAVSTNDGLTMLVVGWPIAEKDVYRSDIEGNYLKTLDLAPEFADRVRAASLAERFSGGGVANFFRKPYGPGWVLIGDAGYTKDPITAQGIQDAFGDAERCAATLDEILTGRREFDAAMADYQQARDAAALPIYGFTTELATLGPPPAEMQQVLGAVQGDQAAMDDFVSLTAGTVSPVEFFDPVHIRQLLTGAEAR